MATKKTETKKPATTKKTTTPAKKPAAKKPTGSAADALLEGDNANGVTTTSTKTKAAPKKVTKLTAAAQKKILAVQPLPADAIADTVQAVESVSQDVALPLVSEMLENRDFNQFRMGGLLSVIEANGFWREQGYDKFADFIEGYYGLKYRKANYLMNIYNYLVDSGVEWDNVKDVGWTKLKEFAKFLTVDNVDEWVERAEAMTVIALQEYIKTLDDEGNEKPAKKTKADNNPTDVKEVSTMTFKLHVDQKALVREALDQTKEKIDTEHDNVALEHISNELLSGSLGKKPKPVKQKSLAELIKAEYDKDPDAAISTVLEIVAELYPEYDIHVAAAEPSEESDDTEETEEE